MAKTPKAKKTTKKPVAAPTLVTLLLDRSASMSSIHEQTVAGFNAYVDELKKNPENLEFNFLQFDTQGIDKVYVKQAISGVPTMTMADFKPRGGTPLIDAAYKTIKAVEHAVGQRTDAPKIIVAIQTDGEELNSREYTWEDLASLINSKKEAGWEFNFMGAGIDAYKQASRMGIGAGHTVAYSTDMHSTKAMFGAAASNTQAFRSGTRSSTFYDAAQKMASGDVFDPDLNKTPAAKPVDPSIAPAPSVILPRDLMGGVSVDLTSGLDLTTANSAPHASPVKDPTGIDLTIGAVTARTPSVTPNPSTSARPRGPIQDFTL